MKWKKEKNHFYYFITSNIEHGSFGTPTILYNNKVIGLHGAWGTRDIYNRVIKEYRKLKEEKLNIEKIILLKKIKKI